MRRRKTRFRETLSPRNVCEERCFGCKPVPSLKICTNSPTYQKMIDDMDVDAGVILDGVPVEEVGRQIFEKLIAVASGEQTKSEAQGIGDEEFCPWSIGPTLKGGPRPTVTA